MNYNISYHKIHDLIDSCVDLNYYTYLIIIVTVLILISYEYPFVSKRNVAQSKTLKGPIGLPIFGNLFQISSESTHLQLTEFSHRHGNIYKLKLGNCNAVVVNGVEAVHQALYTQAEDFCCRPAFEAFASYSDGYSLSFQKYGSTFKQHRAAAVSALRGVLKPGVDGTESVAAAAVRISSRRLIAGLRRLVADVDVDVDGRGVDIEIRLQDAIARTLYRVCFGGDMDAEYERFAASPNPSTQLFAVGRQPELLPAVLRPFWQATRKRASDSRMRQLCDMNERKVREYRESADGSPCILGFMLEAASSLPDGAERGDQLTTKHLLSTTVEMISAGTDTSSTTLSWLLAYMARYRVAQADLQRELDADPATPLLDATVLEVTRLSTIVPFALPHRCRRRCQLLGYAIAEGTLVLANLWSVGRDRHFWGDDVDDFRPRRFLDESTPAYPKINRLLSARLMLFGAGRRRCIGESLGKLQVNTIFRDIVHEFQILGAGEIDLTPKFGDILKPKPFRIHLLQR